MSDEFDPLRKVRRVEAPPFLFTRIEAKIQRKQEEWVSVKWVWGTSMALVLLALFNLSVLNNRLQIDATQYDAAEAVATSMQLLDSNQLYNE